MAPERDNYVNCFLENKQFRMNGKNYIAYGNGKAAGRTGQVKSNGPHAIIKTFGMENKQEVDQMDLVVLHYVSCNLDETVKKYKTYGNFKNDQWEWAQYHLDARDTMNACNEDCKDKAKKLFEKRMKKDDDEIIEVDIFTILNN